MASANFPVGARVRLLAVGDVKVRSRRLQRESNDASASSRLLFLVGVGGCWLTFGPSLIAAGGRFNCVCVVVLRASQSSKTIIHGSVATVTVEDGEVAVIRNVGKRQTLGPGRYKLEAPQQV